MRKIRRVTVIVLAISALGYYALLADRLTFGGDEPTFDLHDARVYARTIDGPQPVAIHVEKISRSSFPQVAVFAGRSWSPMAIPIYSYQVHFEDGTTLIIDTAVDEELSMALSKDAWFDPVAFKRMQDGMERASKIILTHEHMDHIGGLTTHPNLQSVLDVTELSEAQLDDPSRQEPAMFPDGALDGYVPITYSDYQAVMPGVALIKAAGHSPGSQMVLVTLKDGSEFLFVGDIGWNMENINKAVGRPRLVSWLFLNEDRGTVGRQLKALREIADTEPDLRFVVAHDEGQMTHYLEQGIMQNHFE